MHPVAHPASCRAAGQRLQQNSLPPCPQPSQKSQVFLVPCKGREGEAWEVMASSEQQLSPQR